MATATKNDAVRMLRNYLPPFRQNLLLEDLSCDVVSTTTFLRFLCFFFSTVTVFKARHILFFTLSKKHLTLLVFQ